MSDHPLGRRSYDGDIQRRLGEIQGTLVQILAHVERQNGRTARLEEWRSLHEIAHAGAAGASAERGRWLSWAGRAGQKVVPAGGIALAVTALLHWLAESSK